jgi:glycosyltransferase involved in cell wall biosynthesis
LHSLWVQNYPKRKIEILIIDGGSTDCTVKVAKQSGAKVKIIKQERDNPEGRKAIGLHEAKNELVLFIDSDNLLPHTEWLMNMVRPLMEQSDIVATQPLRFHHDYKYKSLNRYFALVGVGDPVVYYLGKSDHLSWSEEYWTLNGQATDQGEYYRVSFTPDNAPTCGANGYLARRDLLLKTKCTKDEFFHIDVNYDLINLGFNTFGFIKDDIIHLSGESLVQYAKKRLIYMKKYYGLSHRRYLIYSSTRKEDRINLMAFIIYTLTLLRPTYDAIRGYKKVPDKAWFLHPIMCQIMLLTYGSAITFREAKILPNRFKVKFHREA